MSEGWVYVLVNEAMPGLVKIGRTARHPQTRADELYQTGVPAPFSVFASHMSPDCEELEEQVHEHFEEVRYSKDREFFEVCALEASTTVEKFRNAQLSSLVCHYSDEKLTCVWAELAPLEAKVSQLCVETAVPMHAIVAVLLEAGVPDLRSAAARVQARWDAQEAKKNAVLVRE